MYIAKGNTYPVKDALKAVGFNWDRDNRQWVADDYNKDDWDNKYCSQTWHGRKNGRLCAEVTIEEVNNG